MGVAAKGVVLAVLTVLVAVAGGGGSGGGTAAAAAVGASSVIGVTGAVRALSATLVGKASPVSLVSFGGSAGKDLSAAAAATELPFAAFCDARVVLAFFFRRVMSDS